MLGRKQPPLLVLSLGGVLQAASCLFREKRKNDETKILVLGFYAVPAAVVQAQLTPEAIFHNLPDPEFRDLGGSAIRAERRCDFRL
jgi:hypothetical protein